MHYLVATDSVHATAAACDYLEGRLATGDGVTVATLETGAERDAGDAANVATARLVGQAEVTTVRLDGETPVEALLEVVTERDADVVVTHVAFGAEPTGDVSEPVAAVIGRVAVPVVVLPGLGLE